MAGPVMHLSRANDIVFSGFRFEPLKVMHLSILSRTNDICFQVFVLSRRDLLCL